MSAAFERRHTRFGDPVKARRAGDPVKARRATALGGVSWMIVSLSMGTATGGTRVGSASRGARATGDERRSLRVVGDELCGDEVCHDRGLLGDRRKRWCSRSTAGVCGWREIDVEESRALT